jgi:hypothetical protein
MCKNVDRKTRREKSLEKSSSVGGHNIKVDLRGIGWGVGLWAQIIWLMTESGGGLL